MNYVIYRKYGDVLGRGTHNTHGELNKAEKQSMREENMSGLLLPKHLHPEPGRLRECQRSPHLSRLLLHSLLDSFCARSCFVRGSKLSVTMLQRRRLG